jgi:transaldolase
MRPEQLKTRIFLDGGDPAETRQALDLLGFLDGQTTNPTLIAKNPEIRQRIERDGKLPARDLTACYRDVVKEISSMIPQGSVSIEVYADRTSRAEAMLGRAGRCSPGYQTPTSSSPPRRRG